MPRVKPEDRKRARRPKTRSGCKTCKIRRVKCDEVKPSCKRCTSTGRICDGYDADSPSSSDSQLSVLSSPMRSSIFACEQQHRSFSFFAERTSHQLSGYSICDFWNRAILQAAQVDDGVRCSVVALASLHEHYEQTGRAGTGRDEFALQQYNLAIRQHLDGLKDPVKDPTKIDNYMVSSLLFMCIELIQGHYLSALSLLKGAVMLWDDRTMDARAGSSWPVDIFGMILGRLQSQAISLLGPGMIGRTVPPRLNSVSGVGIPERFTSVAEAKLYFEFYLHSHTLSKTTIPTALQPETATFELRRTMLARWTSAFKVLLKESDKTMTNGDRRTANTLKTWLIVMGTGLSIDHGRDEDDQELWDQFIPSCAEVVRLAETVIIHDDIPDHGSHMIPYQITLDFGVVGPLYDVARICRDPIIRRKAIHLLRAYPCREGLWDSRLAARSAERQMEIEEAAVPEVMVAADIPGWARITSAMPTFHPGDRWATVVYIRQRSQDRGEPESFREELEW